MSDEILEASKSAVPLVPMMCIGGAPLHAHLCQNPITGRVDILQLTSDGKKGDLINAFRTERAAWVWATEQYKQGKLPLS